MATHSSILAWRIPWTEKPGGLQSMGSQELDMTEHTHTHIHTSKYRMNDEVLGALASFSSGKIDPHYFHTQEALTFMIRHPHMNCSFTGSLCLHMRLNSSGDCCFVARSCPALTTSQTTASQEPLSVKFPRQEYWSGLPFPPPGDLPNPRLNLHLPHGQADFFFYH